MTKPKEEKMKNLKSKCCNAKIYYPSTKAIRDFCVCSKCGQILAVKGREVIGLVSPRTGRLLK